MSLPFTGQGAGLGWGVETTPGTAVARSNWMRAVEANLARSVERPMSPVLASVSAGFDQEVHDQADNAGGDLAILGTYDAPAFGNLLWAALGSAVSSGGPTFNHNITPGDTIPSYTIEQLLGNSGRGEVFTGMKVDTLVLSQSAGDYLRVKATYVGITNGGEVAAGTPTYLSTFERVIHHQAGLLAWNSQNFARVTSWELTISNALAGPQYLGSLLADEAYFSGRRTAQLKLGLHWDQAHFTGGLYQGTKSDASLAWTGTGGNSLTATLHNAFVSEASKPISSVDVITQNVTLKGLADYSPGTDKGVLIALSNTLGGASYDW